MNLYAIFRRNLASANELAEVDRRSQAELDRHPDRVRKIRSYVFEEQNGTLGAICIYEATGPEAIRQHGEASGVKVDEVCKVTAIDVHRSDPDYAST